MYGLMEIIHGEFLGAQLEIASLVHPDMQILPIIVDQEELPDVEFRLVDEERMFDVLLHHEHELRMLNNMIEYLFLTVHHHYACATMFINWFQYPYIPESIVLPAGELFHETLKCFAEFLKIFRCGFHSIAQPHSLMIYCDLIEMLVHFTIRRQIILLGDATRGQTLVGDGETQLSQRKINAFGGDLRVVGECFLKTPLVIQVLNEADTSR